MSKLLVGNRGIHLPNTGCIASARYIYNEIFNDKIYENENVRIIPGDVVLDVGGNMGLFSIYAREQGASQVIAFEPDPESVISFLKNTYSHGSIQLHPYGAWGSNKECHFLSYDKKKGSSCILGKNPAINDRCKLISIDCVAIDTVCSFGNKIDFIKMDIEGAELQALKGAKGIIKRDKPKLSISVYHKPEDILEIPAYILSLVPEYVYTIEKSPSGYNEAIAKFYIPQEAIKE